MGGKIRFILNTKRFLILFSLFVLSACSGGGDSSSSNQFGKGVIGPEVSGTPDTFRGAGVINNDEFCFGGPLKRCRTGDVLLQNDQIRLVIQKPDRVAGVCSYGGNIIDADLMRPSSEPGQDNFGIMCPLFNINWTADCGQVEVVNGDFANGPVVIRNTCTMRTHWIDARILTHFAKAGPGVDLVFSDRFNDFLDPFSLLPGLKDINTTVEIDYVLAQNSSAMRIDYKITNEGDEEVPFPVGSYINCSGGAGETFIPKKGFNNTALMDNTPALACGSLEQDVGVSYAYFHDPLPFIKPDGTLPAAAALFASGVVGMVFGEEALLNLFPLNTGDPTINFKLAPQTTTTVTSFFTVGSGDIATAMQAGYEALGVSRVTMTGTVTDANGQSVERARITVLDTALNDSPVTQGFSDSAGQFQMELPTGIDAKSQFFGSGQYRVTVFKEGYVLGSGPNAGSCSGGSLDPNSGTVTGVNCSLGSTGMVSVSATVTDSSGNSRPGPARVTIVGADPSPAHGVSNDEAPEDFGKFKDIGDSRPYGIVDIFFLDPAGNLGPQGNPRVVAGTNSFQLEPGNYRVCFNRGPEYSMDCQALSVSSGGTASAQGSIQRVITTPGYVSHDMHVHSIQSPDSSIQQKTRLQDALAAGLDCLISSDHAYIADYRPLAQQLGYDTDLCNIPGMELTPLANGHLLLWPLEPDSSRPDFGAYDYTIHPNDNGGPNRELFQSLSEILNGVEAGNEGTQVLNIAHLSHHNLGAAALTQMASSKAFNDMGVEFFSTFVDPLFFRLAANTNQAGGFQAPFPHTTSTAFPVQEFTSAEVLISEELDGFQDFLEMELPTVFNLLNLGKRISLTSDSDNHVTIAHPTGQYRNYTCSSVDPQDGMGTYPQINPEELAVNTNAACLTMSHGIFAEARLASASGLEVKMGETLAEPTGQVTLNLHIKSPDWVDWNCVDIYANTVSIPALDDLSGPTNLSAADFHAISNAHEPRYLAAPIMNLCRNGGADGSFNQSVANGVRSTLLSIPLNFSEDTWIMAVVYGDENAQGLFPYAPKGVDTDIAEADLLNTFDTNPSALGGMKAFAVPNPIYLDVDGDTNGDGDPFEALWIADGSSPLAL